VSTSYGTRIINGQQVPVLMSSGSLQPPAASGPTFRGPGQSPLATIPKPGGGAVSTVGGNAGAISFTPVTMLVLAAMFVLGVLGLRYIHWRG
jgi:hypothetical protein